MNELKKKHYVAIAEIMKDRIKLVKEENKIQNNFQVSSWYGCAEELADYFEKENTKFDRKRFLESCGIKE